MATTKKAASPAGPSPKGVEDVHMSVGNVRNKDYPAVKTSGVKMRGAGAATKGTMSRGPMA